MKIENENINKIKLFSLDEGDIFLCDDCYYIAGCIDVLNHARKCYNLFHNDIEIFHNNFMVIYWKKDNVTLTLGN